MATKNPQDTLARHVLEKDLSIIAKSIGSNWELLAPYLLETNGMTTVEHIKADHAKTEMRIFYLLLKWSNETGPDATLGLLFHKMLQPGTSVMIEWRTIAKKLDIDERQIRACKAGYKHPVQETHTNQPNDKVIYASGEISPKYQTSVDGGQPDNEERKMEVEREFDNEEVKMEVDGRQRSEAGKVGPSLQDRRNEKSYRPPKDTCIFDGRLIKLEKADIEELDKSCKESVGEGGFGKVYRSKDVSNGFGMQIALKKIPFKGKDSSQTRSIRREMIASRILHPFILPLLAVVERPLGEPEFWIVSPFFEGGDLHKANENKTKKLKEKDRVKILLHLATAIQYIHTEVPNVRNAILHKDISSKNVVLDAECNARLIDFGLAREKDDKTTAGAGKTHYTHPDFGTGKGATECWDYYSFGVVVREMLTGLGPDGLDGKFLKNMTRNDVLENTKLWSQLGNDRVLNGIAHQCLTCVGWTVDKFQTEVVEKMKGIWGRFCQRNIVDVQDTKCHICMINPIANKTSMTQKHPLNCPQRIKVCIACEKNSFLNPITCYCGTELSPLGSRWGALLIAGNDNDKVLAKTLTGDVAEIKKLLTSKAPRIVGISDNNVRMVTPNTSSHPNSGEQELLPQIIDNVNYFKEQTEMDTLLIYFSGHCAWDKESGDAEFSSFKLGSDSEILTLADFEELLNDLGNIDKLIIILDRCFPPKISFKGKNRKVIQINACEEDPEADRTKKESIFTNKESLFTKTLIQGLKGKANRPECSKHCGLCKDYFEKSTEFITVSSLFEYLENHIEKPKPRMIQDSHSSSSNIAYFTDEQVLVDFTDNENQKSVQLEYLQNMEELKQKLAKDFHKDESRYSVKVQRDTYRKDRQFEDCDTIEKVMSAWVQRQPLIVQFELI